MSLRRSSAVVLTLMLPVGMQAQTVSGKVFQRLNSKPLAGAMVQIQNARGIVIATGSTNANGVYAVRVQSPGEYRWRVVAIGYNPISYQAVTVPSVGVILPDTWMVVRAPTLTDLTARGKPLCGATVTDAPLLASVLDAAETSLGIMEQTLASAEYGFELRETITTTGRASIDSSLPQPPRAGVMVRWPSFAAGSQELARDGFSVIDFRGQIVRRYYGPDRQVLFSPWFLDSHCFSFNARAKSTDSLITLRFEPAPLKKGDNANARVDIAGDLVFARSDLSLRRVSWEYTNLPDWIKKGQASGYLEFANLEGQVWYPVRWSMVVPSETRAVSSALSARGESQTLRGPVTGTLTRTSEVVRVVKNPPRTAIEVHAPRW